MVLKGESFREQREEKKMKQRVLFRKKIGRVRGICDKNPQILF
jgi:hypothetical protein